MKFHDAGPVIDIENRRDAIVAALALMQLDQTETDMIARRIEDEANAKVAAKDALRDLSNRTEDEAEETLGLLAADTEAPLTLTPDESEFLVRGMKQVLEAGRDPNTHPKADVLRWQLTGETMTQLVRSRTERADTPPTET